MTTDTLPDDYESFTVSDVQSFVADVEDHDVLAMAYEREKETKDRKTAIAAIEERLEALADDADVAEVPTSGPEVLAYIEEKDLEYVNVRAARGVSHAAGYSFASGEVKRIHADAATKSALRRGKLQFVAGGRYD